MTQLAARIAQHIAALTRFGPRHPDNPQGVRAAQEYITGTLEGFGYEVAAHQYGAEPHQTNYTVTIGSTDQPLLDIGAHWDTVPGSPGADDNASGTAGLLEIARQLHGTELPQPVRLCFFAEEEAGGLPGSTAHVSAALQRGERISAGISLEMIAYRSRAPGSQQLPPNAGAALTTAGIEAPDTGDFIAVVADETARLWVAALLGAAARESLPALPLVAPKGAIGDAGRSDHAAYWQHCLPGIMITDTANFRNPHYHQPGDTLETLDLEFAAQVTATLLAAVRGGTPVGADQIP